jgi:hypothetical protein
MCRPMYNGINRYCIPRLVASIKCPSQAKAFDIALICPAVLVIKKFNKRENRHKLITTKPKTMEKATKN